MKVAINGCWGGFHISDKACERLIELGMPVMKEGYAEAGVRMPHPYIYDMGDKRLSFGSRYYFSTDGDKDRANPLLIQVIEELGEDAADRSVSKIKIVEIPDGIDWYIHDYDGMKSVEENHASWS